MRLSRDPRPKIIALNLGDPAEHVPPVHWSPDELSASLAIAGDLGVGKSWLSRPTDERR